MPTLDGAKQLEKAPHHEQQIFVVSFFLLAAVLHKSLQDVPGNVFLEQMPSELKRIALKLYRESEL